MATMIPDLDPRLIDNDGEQRVYAALRQLPASYTVLYSYKFRTAAAPDLESDSGEADFVVVSPTLGYLVIEVKQGKVGYSSGQWYEQKQGRQELMSKDPVAQVEKAKFAILDRYKEKAETDYFPLKVRHALWFPECSHVWGNLPANLARESVLLEPDLDSPEAAIRRAFATDDLPPEKHATDLLIQKALAPRCRFFAGMDEEIDRYDRESRKVLTDEQERILDETELDKRKVFFGAAGTGKTFLALEKARRLKRAGKRVFLTCFNRNLATYMASQVPSEVVCGSFHDYLLGQLARAGRGLQEPPEGTEMSRFYDEILPTAGFEYFAEAPMEEKFDAIIVDEGQDFSENWYTCLKAMLRDENDGELYVFADPNQDLFRHNIDALRAMGVSQHRLTRNLRNTEHISTWIGSFVKEGGLRPGLLGGLPVVHVPWDSGPEEKRLIEAEVGRLVSQGIKPSRIVILSPNRLEKSSLQGCTKIKEWDLEDFKNAKGNCIRFATIRSFKGLEADVVFLIGLKEGKQTCTDADVYVGGSRARFLLYVFHHKDNPPRGMAAQVMSAKPQLEGE
ncbi:MAG: NERD domain-containing protein [Bacillota bacterium]